MSSTLLIIILLILSVIGYQLGRRKAFASAQGVGGVRSLHSRPIYYGMLTALWCCIPSLFVFLIWQAFEPSIITNIIVSELPEEIRSLPDSRLNLVINDIKNLVSGNIVSGEIKPEIQKAADHYKNLQNTSNAAVAVIIITLAVFCILVLWRKINPTLRARNQVEKIITFFLIACSTFAIFTTIGIVLSVLF